MFTLADVQYPSVQSAFNSTSLSVCEAEMMVVKETTTQAIHLEALLKDFGEAQNAPTIVHTDSKAAHDILLFENHSRTMGT